MEGLPKKKKEYVDPNQTELNFDEPSKEKIEMFGGFESEQERIDVARNYKQISPDKIKNFYKINNEIFYKNDNGEFEPASEWLKRDEEFHREDPGEEYYGRFSKYKEEEKEEKLKQKEAEKSKKPKDEIEKANERSIRKAFWRHNLK